MLHLFLVASSYGRRAVQFNGGTLWNKFCIMEQMLRELRTASQQHIGLYGTIYQLHYKVQCHLGLSKSKLNSIC